MLNIYIWISAALALIFIILGILVVTRYSKSLVNRLFLAFSILVSGWLMTNYIGGNIAFSHSVALVGNRLVFFFGLLTLLSLNLFINELTHRRTHRLWQPFIGLNLLVAFAALTPLVVQNVKLQNQTYAIDFNSFAYLYFGLLVIDFLLVIIIAALAAKRQRGLVKSQTETILASLAATLVGVIITNGMLPFVFNYYGLANIGSFFVIITVAGLAYSIIRHRLFDIRAFVVRSVAYLLTFSVVALIYVLPTVVLIYYLTDTRLKPGTFTLLVILTLVAALLFHPLKVIFNKSTNRIFFRDYYEPQSVLDQLSHLLVGTVDLRHIKRGSIRILNNSIKPVSVSYRLIAEQAEKRDALLELLLAWRRDIIVFDEFDRAQQSPLHTAMAGQNLALAARLKTSHGDLGFITLGFKQSGAAYSEEDIRLLGTIADEIAVGLQNALRFEEIQQFNITLQDKVDDATKQLRHANSRLKDLDQTKDEFISMASHQLRTPLTSIKGYLSMVLEGDAGKINKAERQMIQQAFDSAERMVFLIADLLNVSRLQSGKFVIDSHPTDLAQMVEAEVAQLQKAAAEHHLTLNYKKPTGVPVLNLDETKVRQVVMNFMDNAIYYTPAGGKIDINLNATDSNLSFTVTDTGLGVPRSEQRHLFTKFYRAGNARKMRPDGTGLGLFMAKKVIAAQGGTIIFKSTEGKGSTFGFSFPRASLEVKQPAPRPVAQEEPAKAEALV